MIDLPYINQMNGFDQFGEVYKYGERIRFDSGIPKAGAYGSSGKYRYWSDWYGPILY